MEYLKDLRIWLICLAIVVILNMCDIVDAVSKEDETYWIGANITVLTFLGNPHSHQLKPVKFTTAVKQKVKLFHKKSGRGIYAFYLMNLIVLDEEGKRKLVRANGYFLAKRRQVSTSYWLPKTSMKKKTKRLPKPEPETDFDFRHIPESEETPITIW